MIPWLSDNDPFPPVEHALRSPDGLLAAGGKLSPLRLLEAYRHGIFPWFNPGEPVLWWSPDPRMVLIPEEFRVSRSLARVLRNAAYEVRTDTAFERVMRGCAAPRAQNRTGQHGTWIHENMIAAYCELHRLGYAHSVEVWMPKNSFRLQTEGESRQQQAYEMEGACITPTFPQRGKEQSSPLRAGEGWGRGVFDSTISAQKSRRSNTEDLELAGGLYGVCIGRMFYAESMFSKADNASKIALAHLARQFERWRLGSPTPSGTGMIDCQMKTSHLASLGARQIPRGEFIAQLQELIHCAPISDWRFDTGLFR